MRYFLIILLMLALLSSCRTKSTSTSATFAHDSTSIATAAVSHDIIRSFDRWQASHKDSLSITIEEFEKDTLKRRITITNISHGEESGDSATVAIHTDTLQADIRSASDKMSCRDKEIGVGENCFHSMILFLCVMLFLGTIAWKKGHS